MSKWLDPVRQALDAAPQPVIFFFRDDDAGWDDERLFKLLDQFADHDLPIDLAVIPQALTQALARDLCGRIEARPGRLRVHQHGFAHVNHESEGRKCEFGPSRPRALQQRDIESGRNRLAEFLGSTVHPIFTPPWNRCTPATGACLVELGFRVLSRDYSAAPMRIAGLAQLPVRVDWFARRQVLRLNREALGAMIAEAVTASEPVGVMLHHALMDTNERQATGELLALLAAHKRAHCHLMQALAEAGLDTKAP